jgi:Type-IV b secretion system, inner-membrane complex component
MNNKLAAALLCGFLIQVCYAETDPQQPQAAQPQAAEPQAAEPQAVQPQAVQPQAVQPQAVQPQAVQPQAAEPQAAEPQAAEPQAAEPQGAQPQGAQGAKQKAVPPEQLQKALNQPIDCEYKLSTPIAQLPDATLLKWSENAALEAFTLDHKTIDAQLKKVKSCFTKQGWQSFSQALKKSGNLEAIKKQKLNMSSKIDGKLSIADKQEKSLKVNIPLEVTYKNSQKQMVQKLVVDLMIGVKISGDLGINQIVAQTGSDKQKQQQLQKQKNKDNNSAAENQTKPAS